MNRVVQADPVVEEQAEVVEENKNYCICQNKYNDSRPMIMCDGFCNEEWYHLQCMGITDYEHKICGEANSNKIWICQNCIVNEKRGLKYLGGRKGTTRNSR